MNHQTLPDKELWNAVSADDTRAFAVLYNRHWKKLYNSVLYYLKDAELAEQILHDVFVVLWRRRKFLQIENFNSYIYITAKYHVYKHLKAVKTVPVDFVDHFEVQTVQVVNNTAEDKLNYDDLELKLKRYLSDLPEACRKIFLMSRIHQRTNDEIAKELGITRRTVENQITIALKHLRLSRSEIALFCILYHLL